MNCSLLFFSLKNNYIVNDENVSFINDESKLDTDKLQHKQGDEIPNKDNTYTS